MKKFIAMLAMSVAMPLYAQAPTDATAEKVLQCARDNFPTSVSVRKVTFTNVGKAGESNRILARVYGQLEKQPSGARLVRGTLIVEEPANLRGSAYLIRETEDYLRDGMFVYLPAVGRVRRISGEVGDRSLLGTEFSYFEYKQMSNAFGDLSGKLQGTETISGRASYVMSFKPLEGVETRYDLVKAWIDKQTCLVMAAEFISAGKTLKRMTAPPSGIAKSGDFHYLQEMQMADLQQGSKTILRIDEVTLNEELSSLRFSPKTFYLTK